MSRWKTLAAVAALGIVTCAAARAQPQSSPPAARAMTLTAQDYAEIQQLSNRYAWAIDTCTNGAAVEASSVHPGSDRLNRRR